MSQLRLFDQQVVEHFKGTLGSFDIEDEEVEHYAADAQVVLIVTATVDGATHKRAKDGDWIRVNKLAATSVRVVVGELREELIDIFSLTVADQLTLPITTMASSVSSSTSTSTPTSPSTSPPSSPPSSASPPSSPSPSSPSPTPSPTTPSSTQPAPAAAGPASTPVEQNGTGPDLDDDEPDFDEPVSTTDVRVETMQGGGLLIPIQLPKPGDAMLRRFLGET